MNPLHHLEGIGTGKRIFLVGSGPSLAETDLDALAGEDSIAMNRIDLIYSRTSWRPTYYIFASSNCSHHQWGRDWSESVMHACSHPQTTGIVWRAFVQLIEWLCGPFPPGTIYLENVSESPIGSDQSFSTNAVERIDKAGTTMNIALQLAYFMGYAETYLIGCDSNWETATNTPGEGDPNHFDPSYHASIASGEEEFRRMNETHKVARRAFDEAGLKIFNAGSNSALTAYEKKPLAEVI